MKQLTPLFSLILIMILTDGCRKMPVGHTKPAASGSALATDLDSKRRQGIDFTAHGATPGWALDIDFTKAIRFQAPNGPVLIAAVPKSQREPGGSGILFDAQVLPDPAGSTRRTASRPASASRRNDRLKVIISPVVCRDNRNGQVYAYGVTVETNGQRYSGCGMFLNGMARLNSQWVLETYRGQRLHAEQFVNRKMPTLDINVKEKRLQGFTGCNTLQGQVKADGDNVRFEAVSTTRRACPYDFETGFLAALQSVTLYRISNNRLTLLADGKYVMTFRKTVKKETPATGP
ncbi:heat shock protein HslJ [Larkinella arboricola]|uniref:Heat shock protein HslJ n=1 Tax=Larkinella arboricola TaxID=643671 RepID=A0A327WSM1_LARAB|nr:META domain-containing protein [Larkinella arboricola]RAJ95682.1 heat shock protein HslJ [Larkinella arboricola]